MPKHEKNMKKKNSQIKIQKNQKKKYKKIKIRKKNERFYRVIKPFLKKIRIKKFEIYSFKKIKKAYNFNFKKLVSNILASKNLISKKITIRVTHNNLFCTFLDLKKNTTLHIGSGGLYRIKISRRKFKRLYKNILFIFFAKIKKYFYSIDNTLFNIKAPTNIKKKICKLILSQIKKIRRTTRTKKKAKNIIFNFIPKKCFNGCRAKKKIRKKRRLYRIYK
jgi:hypothetical protein